LQEQRAGHRQKQIPLDLRQAALRLEVSPAADEPRPAGNRHQRRRHVRRADHRQADQDRVAHLAGKPAHYYEIKIDTKLNQPQILNGRGEGVDISPGAKARPSFAKTQYRVVEADHGTRVTIELEAIHKRGRGGVDEYSSRRRSPIPT